MTIPRLVWFEIPVVDLDRAVRFYEAVFQVSLTRDRVGACEVAMFPGDTMGGCLIKAEGLTPSDHGCCCFFDLGEDLPAVLARVGAAGGSVLTPKTMIAPEIGFDASFRDSEGNRIGLYSKT